jgi:hypothetical protein
VFKFNAAKISNYSESSKLNAKKAIIFLIYGIIEVFLHPICVGL